MNVFVIKNEYYGCHAVPGSVPGVSNFESYDEKYTSSVVLFCSDVLQCCSVVSLLLKYAYNTVKDIITHFFEKS